LKTILTSIVVAAAVMSFSAFARQLVWDDLNAPGVVRSWSVEHVNAIGAAWSVYAVTDGAVRTVEVPMILAQEFFRVKAVTSESFNIQAPTSRETSSAKLQAESANASAPFRISDFKFQTNKDDAARSSLPLFSPRMRL
jgi:hypothetical protein